MNVSLDAPDDRMEPRQTLAIGGTAALLALLSTPALATLGVLTFVPGLILSVAAPGAFGLVGLGAAVQLYRVDRTPQAVGLGVATVLFALIGAAYGLTTVF